MLLFAVSGCKKDDLSNTVPFTKDDLLNNSWLQKDTFQVFSTDPATGIKEVWKFLEKYTFSENDSFKIDGKIYFKTSNRGTFVFDDAKKEVVFTCDPLIIFIGGIQDPQIWKWTLISYEEDILTVDFRLFDHQTKKFGTYVRRIRYIKQ